MITEDILVAAGYRRYTDRSSDAKWLYQKRIKDDTHTLYFIDLYLYDFEKIGRRWELNMSFDRNDPLFDYCHVKLAVNEQRTVEEIEALAMKIFIANDGKAYGD